MFGSIELFNGLQRIIKWIKFLTNDMDDLIDHTKNLNLK